MNQLSIFVSFTFSRFFSFVLLADDVTGAAIFRGGSIKVVCSAIGSGSDTYSGTKTGFLSISKHAARVRAAAVFRKGWKTRCNNGYAYFVVECGVVTIAPNDIGARSCFVLQVSNDFADFSNGNFIVARGNVEQYFACPENIVAVEQGRLQRGFGGCKGPVITLGIAVPIMNTLLSPLLWAHRQGRYGCCRAG